MSEENNGGVRAGSLRGRNSNKVSLTENDAAAYQRMQSKLASVKVEDISDETDSMDQDCLEYSVAIA